jgi:hypothetical protein
MGEGKTAKKDVIVGGNIKMMTIQRCATIRDVPVSSLKFRVHEFVDERVAAIH